MSKFALTPDPQATSLLVVKEGWFLAIDLSRWPRQAWPYREVIAAAVESFSRENRGFDYSKSASQQLKERIVELRHLPKRLEALVLVSHELTEHECFDICLSRHRSLDGRLDVASLRPPRT